MQLFRRNVPPIPKPPRRTQSLAQTFDRFFVWWQLRFTPAFEKHLTMLYYGPRSQGKSLHQARTVYGILMYLDKLYSWHRDLPQAIVMSNQKFAKKIEDKYIYLPRPQGPRLYYWESIQQLRYCPRTPCWKDEYEIKKNATKGGGIKHLLKHRLHDAYVIIDDGATIIPADRWQDLPQWFRKLFAQAGHNGIHTLANCQDPNSVDINFRRYCDRAFKFRKIIGNRRPEAGKPPVRRIWGIYSSREIDAEELWKHGDMTEFQIEEQKAILEEKDGEVSKAAKVVQRFSKRLWKKRYHLIRRKYTEIYDTLQNVPEFMPNTMEHMEIKCLDKNCKAVHVRHRII